MNQERLAIRLMIAQGVLFAAETAAIHKIGASASVLQLAFFRSIAGVALVFVLARGARSDIVRTRQLLLQLLRGAVTLFYMWVMIYSFAHMPFADATAISYTQAAYIAGFSVLILGETVTRRGWAAALIGTFGALLIAKPAFASWDATYFFVLLGTSLNGLAFVLNRYLQRADSEATTMFYTNLIALLGNVPALFLVDLPAPGTVLWLPGIVLLGPLGMFAGILAVRHSSASALGPYTLLRLVIGILGGMVFFREFPDIFSAIGSALIVLSCVTSSGALAMPKNLLRQYEAYPRQGPDQKYSPTLRIGCFEPGSSTTLL